MNPKAVTYSNWKAMLWVCGNCKLCFRDPDGASRKCRGKVSVKNEGEIKQKGRCDVPTFRFDTLKKDNIIVDIKEVKKKYFINC